MTQQSDVERVRRAVLVVDMVESVRLMQAHEDDTIERWRRFVGDARQLVSRYGGRVVKSLGDGLLATCEQGQRAVALSFDIQDLVPAINAGRDDDSQIRLRAGVHVCDVVEDEFDVYGAGVNLAARIATIAKPGGVAGSDDVLDDLLPGIDAHIEDAGLCFMKHLAEPVQVHHLTRPSAQPVEAKPAAALEPPAAPPGIEIVGAMAPTEPRVVAPLTVAVLRLDAGATDPDVAVLGRLASDTLVTRLSSVPTVRAISRLSTEQFQLRAMNAEEIARRSGADYVIDGRLHGSGTQHLLFLKLLDVRAGNVAWADTFTLDATQLLRPDEDVTPPIAQVIVDQMTRCELRRVDVAPLPNVSSQSLQFSAITLMHRRATGDFQRAGEILGHLVDRHPRSAAPHAWAALWHVLSMNKGVAIDVHDADRALDHTHRALDINPDSAMSMAMEAFVQCHLKRDLVAAQKRLADALFVNPSDPWLWLVRSTVESFLGHGEAAWESALRARQLSPMDPLKHYYDGLTASAAVCAERYAEALQFARLSLSKDARHLPTLRALAIAQVHLGQVDGARDTMAKVLQLQPTFNLREYVGNAPPGGEAVRAKWAEALREAGAPLT